MAAAKVGGYLRETLAMLQESYAKAAKPYIDRLVRLRSRSAPHIFVTTEQAHALSLLLDNAAHLHTESNHMKPNAKTVLETVSENKMLPAP